MGDAAENKQFYRVEEYLTLEENREQRHEYWRGEIFAMAGTSKSHNICVGNLYIALRTHFSERGCDTFSENILLEVIKDEYYTYPDILVTCNEKDKEETRMVRYPALIIEVLSRSTQAYDVSTKLSHYLNIPGLEAYIMVSRREYMLLIWTRRSTGWHYETVQGLEQSLHVEALGLIVKLQDIYQNVALEK